MLNTQMRTTIQRQVSYNQVCESVDSLQDQLDSLIHAARNNPNRKQLKMIEELQYRISRMERQANVCYFNVVRCH
jgi:hypothetical protein